MKRIETAFPSPDTITKMLSWLEKIRREHGIAQPPSGHCAANFYVAENLNGQFWRSTTAQGEILMKYPTHHVAVVPLTKRKLGLVLDISSRQGFLGVFDMSSAESIQNGLDSLTHNHNKDWELLRDFSKADTEDL
jgi:hypothetical protein